MLWTWHGPKGKQNRRPRFPGPEGQRESADGEKLGAAILLEKIYLIAYALGSGWVGGRCFTGVALGRTIAEISAQRKTKTAATSKARASTTLTPFADPETSNEQELNGQETFRFMWPLKFASSVHKPAINSSSAMMNRKIAFMERTVRRAEAPRN